MSSIYTSGNDKYFYSNKIKVFPCAYRSVTYDATARLNTEYNFTHLPHMVDKASYIIKFDDEELICVIQGYYFEIELGTDELGTNDSTTLQNKYLNICAASPNGAGSIESPHLCSWESINIEDTLDITKGSNTFFAGLKISSGEALSKNTYQCYALKLDDSAKLPISANKIENIVKNSYGVENGTGKPISQEFTTGALDVKTGDTSILKAENTEEAGKKVTIEASTNITGTTTIKGTTEIKNSSGTATDGNLTVAGKGGFSNKLTVYSGGATITGYTNINGTTDIKGKTIIGTGTNKTEIDKDTITTSKIIASKIIADNLVAGNLVINKNADHILEIKDKSNTPIFSVNTDSGITYAKQINADNINATVEGTIDKAVNVTTSIAGTPITDIFGSTSNKIDRLKLRIIEPDTDATWDSGADQSVKIILKKDTDPVKAVSFFLAKGGTATVVKADEFIGVAETAQAFDFPATISLYGDVDGKAESKYGWNIQAEIGRGKVTNDKLAGSITNDKLVNNSITIGSTEVGLGGSVGDHESRRIGILYGTRLNLSGDIVVNNIGNIKVNNASLKSSSLVKVDSSTVKICDSALSVTSDSVKIGSKLTITPSSGNIVSSEGTVEAASFNATSDRRLKENIIDYKPEKSILDLPIKKFDFIDGPKNQIGCIAQDLKEICPEIVNENEKGYLSIQENKLVYLLLDEVKKLKNEVEELKRK